MKPEIISAAEKKLVGMRVRLVDGNGQRAHLPSVVPPLWQKLRERLGAIPLLKGNQRFVVIENDLEPNPSNPTYSALFEVEKFSDLPADMVAFTIKDGRYARFEFVGLPSEISGVAIEAHHKWLPQSGETLREPYELIVFPPDYVPNNPNTMMEYWVPLR